MSKLSRSSIAAIAVVALCTGCDQATKAIARTSLSHSEPIRLLSGIVTLAYAENLGAFLGMGVRLPLGIISASLLVLIITVFMLKTDHIRLPQLLCLSLLAGGGIGNLIDRIANDGAVVDFVMLSLGPLHTGILNVADLAITFGALGFALFSLADEKRQATTRER